jgi:hypothetical protein
MKNTIRRITGFWCLEFDCWPEDHPGCARREERGCDGCPKTIFQISVEKSDGIEIAEEDTIQLKSIELYL